MKSKDIRFKVTIGIGLVFVFSIIPLLLVARYNHGWQMIIPMVSWHILLGNKHIQYGR